MSLSVFAKPLNSLKFERKCLGPQEKKSKKFFVKKISQKIEISWLSGEFLFDAQDDENVVDVDSSGK